MSLRRRAASLLAAFWMASATAAAQSREVPIEAPGPLGPLKGTLQSPVKPESPVVLIVPGSGPTDRDGNNPLGIRASTYKLLAGELAAKGVASVRVDKRGMFGSAAAITDANAVTIADYAADVRSWVEAIRRQTGAACIWVLGHSEGGLVALAAGPSGNDICGLILVATPGRRAGDVLRQQLQSNPANAPVLDQARAAIDALENGRKVEIANMHPALVPLFQPSVQSFLIHLFAIDPAGLIAGYKKPILILQGERDIQVGVADARRLKQAAPWARLVLLPDTNHVLKPVATDDRAANIATYGDPALPLAPHVTEAIATFIASAPGPH
jgi:pimeloyl-ACP methyl ester carboxylesterase